VTGLGKLALLVRVHRSLRREHRAAPFDVLHGLWADEAGFLATAAASALCVPAVVSLLGGELVGLPEIGYGTQLSIAGRVLVRRALRKAERVTVGSRAMERLAAACVRPERLHRLPLGVDIRLFHPRGERQAAVERAGRPRLLHVASLAPVKDQATLLRALARVVRKAPAAHLHLVGDGPQRPTLERLAGELGVGDHLTFHGAVDHDRLPEYYRAADLAVLSSRFESQSMVALEAAACGLVTVGTAVGLLPELVGTEFTAPVGDAEALAAAVLTLARDPAHRAALGEANRAAVEARYTLSGSVRELSALYCRLAPRAGREMLRECT
jgi:glycosyltransferase involved in cell wall biosynthesis